MKGVFTVDCVRDANDPYEELLAMKEQHPDLKASVFVIPGMTSEDTISKYKLLPWVELGLNSFYGNSFECFDWSKDEAEAKLDEGMKRIGAKCCGFKSSKGISSGATFEVLREREMWTLDHPRNIWHTMYFDPVKRAVQGMEPNVAYVHYDAIYSPDDWGLEKLADISDFKFASEMAKYVHHLFDEQEEGNFWSHMGSTGIRAVDRVNLMVEMLEPTGKILDLGGNDGTAMWNLKQKHDLDGVVLDVSPFKVAFANFEAGVEAHCGDSASLPFQNDEFEWGYCSHTLEHVDDLKGTLAELHRVCKKGVFVVVPIEDEVKFKLAEKHVRHGDVRWWLDALGAEKISECSDWGEDELICLIRY